MEFKFAGLMLFAMLITENVQGKQPNIIFILVDDWGWNDASFHGSPQIPTPNIDAMAADGVLLSNYYVAPICTPSRSALLTGFYPIHTGLQHNVIYGKQPYGLPLNFTLMPQYLKKLGYSTHAIGKWHLGFFNWDYTPIRRGFDSHFGYWLGHQCYYDHLGEEGSALGYDFRDNEKVAWKEAGQYSTEVFTEKAINVIKNHETSKPLFLYLAHLAVHAGNQYSLVESLPQFTAKYPQISDHKRRLFAGMIGALDDSVGKIFRALREARMLENSVVVISTDNGGAAGGIDSSIGSNWPLRGTKYTLWEGGVRGNGAIWSPLLASPRGAVRKQLMHIVDWLPTLYHIAGGDAKDLEGIDGLNLWESLKNDSPSPRDDILLNIDPIWKMWAIRSGQYKLISGTFGKSFDTWFGPSGLNNETFPIFDKLPTLANSSMVAQTLRSLGRTFEPPTLDWYKKNRVECDTFNGRVSCDPVSAPCLFNIEKDPCEYNNLAETHSRIVELLLSKLKQYNNSAVDPLNPPEDEHADPKYFNFVWSPWK